MLGGVFKFILVPRQILEFRNVEEEEEQEKE